MSISGKPIKTAVLALATAVWLAPLVEAATKQYFVYVGTYTGPQSKGIYVYKIDTNTGKLDTIGLAAESNRPSFLAIHPNRKYLYSVSELGNSTVSAFEINPKTGMLTLLNTVPTKGGSACHLVVDQTGKSLIVANYGRGASVVAFRIAPDGRLSETTSEMSHSGSGPDAARQGAPHAHAVVLSLDNRYVFVPDLGLDKIFAYRLDPTQATLTANDPPFATVPPGSGPRHFAFHPKGTFAYSLNEMKSSVTAFAYDAKKGALTSLQTIANLPEDFTGVSNAAEIDIDAAGKFVYVTNRGHDSITVYAIDSRKGTLTTVERIPTQGKTPRGMKIDPTGRYLIVGNQESNAVAVFKRDASTGRLTPTGITASVGAPVCIEYVPVE